MSRFLRIAVAMVLLAGCAEMPPERVERDNAVLAAIQPCKERHAERLYNPGMISVRQDGVIHYWLRDGPIGASIDIDRCIGEATKGLKVGPWAQGRLVRGAPASVPMTASEKDLLVQVRVNGVQGTMAISTNSALTMVKADYAGRSGLRVVSESPSTRATINGKDTVVPFVRARSLQVGDASVEALDVVVHDTHPGQRAIDGVLGNSFLASFKLNIDRRNNRLTLEPIP